MEDEHINKINDKAKKLGLDYTLGSLIVALKGYEKGTVLIATNFECSHIVGNYEKYSVEKHGVLQI